MSYLSTDPNNVALLADAAAAALQEDRPSIALDLLDRHAALAPLPPKEAGLKGLAAMQTGDFAVAAAIFEELRQADPDDTSLRFNLAWSRAMLKNYHDALELLDAATVEALPQAAMLEIQLLHEQGRFDEAAERAASHLERHPNHQGLLAAVSVLAMDVEDPELARATAARAGDHADALTTLGTLSLGDDQTADALALFERALAKNPAAPRAWVGKGLAELASGSSKDAARDIQHGAELFGDHLGSWIAAGWAQVISGDIPAGRLLFEKALMLDDTFSESHGSLAVVAVLDNRFDEARRLAQIALRLDKASFSGALAQALLVEADGKPDLAKKIIDRALNTPIDRSGKTLAQAMARHGLFA